MLDTRTGHKNLVAFSADDDVAVADLGSHLHSCTGAIAFMFVVSGNRCDSEHVDSGDCLSGSVVEGSHLGRTMRLSLELT